MSTHRSRGLALAALCSGQLMTVLDATIVAVALPSIQDDLGLSQSDLAWVVNGYLIAFGGLLLVAGRLGDMFGRRRMFLAGLAVFTAASALCGVSRSEGLLISARFVQGVGAAMTSAVILGMIVTLYPGQRERTKAIAIYSITISAGASAGLVLGGVLTQAISWHWIFFVNLPVGVLVILAALKTVEHERGTATTGETADVAGALLITAALMISVYAIVGASDHGWSSGRTLALAALSIALFVGFVVRQGRARSPLMPLRMFRSRTVSGANIVQAFFAAGQFGSFFVATLYMGRVLGYDAIQTGLAFLATSVSIGAVSLGLSERLITRYTARPVLIAGTIVVTGGMALLALAGADATYVPDVIVGLFLVGVGAGLAMPANITLAMSAATASDSGLASGLINTTQQVGGAIGVAVLATFATSRTNSLLGDGDTELEALTGGYQLGFSIAAALTLVCVVVATAVIRAEGPVGNEAADGALTVV